MSNSRLKEINKLVFGEPISYKEYSKLLILNAEAIYNEVVIFQRNPVPFAIAATELKTFVQYTSTLSSQVKE